MKDLFTLGNQIQYFSINFLYFMEEADLVVYSHLMNQALLIIIRLFIRVLRIKLLLMNKFGEDLQKILIK